MRLAIIVFLMALQAGVVHAQFPAALQPPPAGNSAAPPLNLNLQPAQQPPSFSQQQPIQQMSANAGPVKPGDQVRVLRGTHIRSGPGEQAYSCGLIEPGSIVTVLDYPAPGSDYTPIAAPDNCFSLIPESVVYHFIRPKTIFIAPQKTLSAVETLMDGTPSNGEYLSSKYTLPKGSLVSIVNEKKIKVLGKEKVYCVIRVGGKEKRFVRTADLEGMAEAAKAMQSPLHAGSFSNQPSNFNTSSTEPLYGSIPEQQATQQHEHLPAQLADQVNAAEQAYQTAMRYGAWEDARMRYQHLLQVDVLSVRILAKNRLEFINELQRNPPVVTTALSPQQGANGYQPVNHEPWIPGGMAPARNTMPVASSSSPPPVKDVVIHSTPPAAVTGNTSKPVSPPVNIPMYSGTANQPSAASPPASSAPPRPASSANVPTAQRVKTSGRLNRAMQYDGINQLYYLTNSQLTATYFLRAVTTSNVRLADYVDKYIEVEGIAFQALIDGQTRQQINVERVRLLP